MVNRALLASVALFGELYDENKDVYAVVAEFIKGAVAFGKRWSFTPTDATMMLGNEFGLTIPEAVVSTALKRLAKKETTFTFDKGIYTVSQENMEGMVTLVADFNELRQQQDAVIQEFISYVEQYRGSLDESRKATLAADFCKYLFDEDVAVRHAEDISAFIVKSQKEPDLTKRLNTIREGFVFYEGVRHTPDVNQIAAWKVPLVIYLDTEHLFNAVGLNGVLYKQLLADLIGLASEPRVKGNRLITLKYFSESAHEVDRFFGAAELIVEGKAALDPSKIAMVSVLNGCVTKSEVAKRRVKFFSDLRTLGITEDDHYIAKIDPKYNLGGTSFINDIKADFESRKLEFAEEKCTSTLQMLSKINWLRGGRNEGPIESVGHIFVSGSFISHYLAFDRRLWCGNGQVTLATDLEYITNRIWFKLKKGLAKGTQPPQWLNVVAKAQVILSSQVNNSVYIKYEQIKREFKSGKLSTSDANYLVHELRSKSVVPETITPTSVDEFLAVIDEQNYQSQLREREILVQQVAEGEAAKAELAKIASDKLQRRIYWITKLSFALHASVALALGLVTLEVLYCGYVVLQLFSAGQDTSLAIASLVVTIILGVMPFVGFRQIRDAFVNSHASFINRYVHKSA